MTRSPTPTEPAPSRPQTPKAPFPYLSEAVTFEGAPGVVLSGALTVPSGEGRCPAVVLIHGSGLHDRDETIFGHKPFLVIADALTRRGIGVLRYDKRGAGASTGPAGPVTTADYAEDAAAAVARLRSRPEIDPDRIGLIGHSEGGVIAPLIAADDPLIAFVVLLAGPGVPGDQLLRLQARLQLIAAGGSEAQADAAEAINAEIYKALKSEAADPTPQILSLLIQAGLPEAAAQAAAAQASLPWVRWFVRHDPAPALKRLACPVLALIGSNDLQVAPSQNLPALRAALADHPRAAVVELPGLNHLFQTSRTGSIAEYAELEETIAPSVLKRLGDWIEAQVTARESA